MTENLQTPEEKGTGLGALAMVGAVHATGLGLPKGGSGQLSAALERCIAHYLVGPFMHPGAGRTGAGRTTAMRMFQDLDIEFGQAIGVEQPVAVAREER